MTRFFAGVVTILMLVSCSSNQHLPVAGAYLGMTISEYQKTFRATYILESSAGRVNCRLTPVFREGRLDSLEIAVDDISDYDTAYTVYELGNDFQFRYGQPAESKETVWAGGSSKFLRWYKDSVEATYQYNYDQNPGTHGLLYTGEATLTFKMRAAK